MAEFTKGGGFKGGRLNSLILRQMQEKERRKSVASEGWAKVGKLSGTGAFKRYDSEALRKKRVATIVEPGDVHPGLGQF